MDEDHREVHRAQRKTSATIISCLRSSRSTSAPAIGPNRNAGSVRAIITPDTARLALPPPSRATIVVTATNPTQSPRDDTVMAANRRANGRCRRRSFSVADRVPRRAATSSVIVDTGGRTSARGGLLRRGALRRRLLRRALLPGGALLGRGLLRGRLLRPRAARAARASDLIRRTSASASGSPLLVTLNSRSSSAPQFQHRSDFGRRRAAASRTPGTDGPSRGGLFTAKSHSG